MNPNRPSKRLRAAIKHLSRIKDATFPGIGYEWYASFGAIALRLDEVIKAAGKQHRNSKRHQNG